MKAIFSLYPLPCALCLGLAAAFAAACGSAEPGDSSSTPGDNPVGAINEAPSAASANRSFTCLQTSSGRAAYRQTVTGQLDANSAPLDVQVIRPATGRLEHSASVPVLVPNYSGGYFKTNYHLDAYSLGSEGTNDYYLLLPEGGVTGTTFGAQLHLFFDHGTYGWWQKIESCTIP